MGLPRKRRFTDQYPPVACTPEDRATVQRLAQALDIYEAEWIRRAIELQMQLDLQTDGPPTK